MSAGLQCWDASGNMVVDLGDYTIKFVGRYRVSIPAGTGIGSVNVPGINGNNSFSSIMYTSGTLGGAIDSNWYSKTRNGGVDILYLPQYAHGAVTVDVEVYQFI